MHRIDDPTAVPTLPAPRAQGTPGYFTGGSPGSSGFAATVVRYEFLNAIQEELAAVVAAANLTLDKTNNNQVVAALRAMLRFKLTQDQYLYISPTGNDSNDGLTPATALKTGQAAWNKALTIDLNNHNLYLQFANGTYTTPIFCSGIPLGIGSASGIVFTGNVSQPSQVVFNTSNVACITGFNTAAFTVQGISFTATGIPGAYQNMGCALYANAGSLIAFNNVIFQHCDWVHVVGANGGIATSNGNPYTIAGGAISHMIGALGGNVTIVNSAVSLTGTPAFTQCFANSSSHGMIAVYGCAFAGAATGPRWNVGTGGLIHTNGGGANFLPGNAAGVTDAATYGVYI
jgi:hypothetical protein